MWTVFSWLRLCWWFVMNLQVPCYVGKFLNSLTTVSCLRSTSLFVARWNSIIDHVSLVPLLIKNLIQVLVYLLWLTLLCEIRRTSCVRNTRIVMLCWKYTCMQVLRSAFVYFNITRPVFMVYADGQLGRETPYATRVVINILEGYVNDSK
jgi:hypothetical protein